MRMISSVERSPPIGFFTDAAAYVCGKTISDEKMKVGIHGVAELSADRIRHALDKNASYTVEEFSTGYLRGCFVTRAGEAHLLLTCDDKRVLNDTELFTQSLDSEMNHEIQKFARLHSIAAFEEYDFPVFNAILESYYEVVAAINRLAVRDVYDHRIKNSFLYLSRRFEKLWHKDQFHAKNHLDWFAWIYHIEISAIATILGTDEPLVLHDVATNTAFWPCLLATSDRKYLHGIRTSELNCSDVDVNQINSTIDTLKRAFDGLETVRPMYLDVTEPSSLLRRADVITANDILEHFHQEISFKVLNNLWQSTRRLLIIHVPFEVRPVAAYGHYTGFDRRKLSFWAAHLDNCRDRSEELRHLTQGHPDPDAIQKFLILERISQ